MCKRIHKQSHQWYFRLSEMAGGLFQLFRIHSHTALFHPRLGISGAKDHRALCILLTVLYGVVPFIPYVSVMLESVNLLSEFFVIVVRVTYIRWNVDIEVLRDARAWFVASIVISLLALVFCYALSQKQYPLISSLCSSVLMRYSATLHPFPP